MPPTSPAPSSSSPSPENTLFNSYCVHIWHRPHALGFPLHAGNGISSCPEPEANTDSFFSSFTDPQCGHFVPFQSLERTSTSLSFSHSRH